MTVEEKIKAIATFVAFVDALKGIERRTILVDRRRRENVAEHTWHVMLAALVFAEFADSELDMLRVLKMLVVHDLPEIIAGDTQAYVATGADDQATRELAAATEIFGTVPDPLGAELLALWKEFEALDTPEARFARAMDRLLPLIISRASGGATWTAVRSAGDVVHAGKVATHNAIIGSVSAVLGEYVAAEINAAVDAGQLDPEPVK